MMVMGKKAAERSLDEGWGRCPCGAGFGKGSVRKRWAGRAGRTWEALSAGGGPTAETSWEARSGPGCLPGENEKGARKAKGMRLSQGHGAQVQRKERRVGGESRGGVRKPRR